MLLNNLRCWLDILPDETHLNILSNINTWQSQFCCMQSYPRWCRILQHRGFVKTRFQTGEFTPPFHELFNPNCERALNITAEPDGKITSVVITTIAKDEVHPENEFLLNAELVGPGILDDPLLDYDTATNNIRGISIAFSRWNPESNCYICSASDKLDITQLFTIRDLVAASVKLTTMDSELDPTKKFTVTLRMTAKTENEYAYFGGWIVGHVKEKKIATDPLQASTNAALPAGQWGKFQLHWASILGNTVLMKQLINTGAYLEQRWNRDRSTDRLYGTPLHCAAMEGHASCVAALLDAGSNIEACNAWQRTPLHLAARYGNTEVARVLVERGANKEARRDTWETPLHFAVEDNRLETVRYLIDAGSDINAKGSRGTPLDFAIKLEHTEIANLLRTRGGQESQKERVIRLLGLPSRFPR